LEASGLCQVGDKLLAVRGEAAKGREGGGEGGSKGGGFRTGVALLQALKEEDFPVALTFERRKCGGREEGGEGGREVFEVVIPKPPVTRWGVVFGASVSVGEGEEAGREGGREVWPVIKAFQRLPGPAQRSGKIKPGMVLVGVNGEGGEGGGEGRREGGREGDIVERVKRIRLPCTVTARDMDVWTQMMAWRPSG
jgi:hypothetical protein